MEAEFFEGGSLPFCRLFEINIIVDWIQLILSIFCGKITFSRTQEELFPASSFFQNFWIFFHSSHLFVLYVK